MHRTGNISRLLSLLIVIIPVVIFSACQTSSTTTGTYTYNVPQIKYLLIARYPDLFWCDPDFYPVARDELPNALTQFSTFRADSDEFAAILHHLNLEVKTDYSDEEKLLVYRQHKLLTRGLEITGTASPYSFSLRTGEDQGYRITGTITSGGSINETTRETSFNTCPICLTEGTVIDSPLGPIPVEDLRQGMIVWTADETGEKIEAVLTKTTRKSVPIGFEMVKITLQDGRLITVSPGHPTADNRSLNSYSPGENLDGSVVTRVENVPYSGKFTYDILPAGYTGLYWANGILLKSTLADK